MLFVGTRGFSGSSYPSASDSGIIFRSTENFSDTNHGTQISLQTTTLGTTTRTERLGVDVDITVGTGNLVIATAGKGLQYKSGANARAGNATLVGGAVIVTNTGVTANTLVMISRKTPGGTLGQLSSSVITNAGANNGFTITSSSATETSTVSYQLIESN